MIHWTNERHFIVGALWATIGIMVTVVITQLLRDYASGSVPGSVRLLGILVLVAWLFFWFSSGKTIKIVYHFVEVLLKRTEERQCQK